jgi:hypothetical protein
VRSDTAALKQNPEAMKITSPATAMAVRGTMGMLK